MADDEKEAHHIYNRTPGRIYQQEVLAGQKLQELFVARFNSPKVRKEVKPKSRRRGPK